MSPELSDPPESGTLPGRYEWVEEPAPMVVPDNPTWNRFSDNMRQWTANAGATVERNDGLGTADAVEHGRGTEEPEATIAYDLQRFPVDAGGNPVGAEAYALFRDEYNRIFGTLTAVGRVEDQGGNFGAGIRQYTVIRGIKFDSVTETLDPSENSPILEELEASPQRVRSYIFHQPDAATAITVSSGNPDDIGLGVTIESEGAADTESFTLTEETDADGNFVEANFTTTTTFPDVDSIWLDRDPVGDISITDGSGTVVAESTGQVAAAVFAGGLTYSDDNQPVDGDRGVPALGTGAHADPIGGTYEYFLGDRVERPDGTRYRPRINSLELTVENSLEAESLHHTRAPSNDVGNRTISLDADVAGPRASHDSMMEALQKNVFSLGHQLSGGVREFPSLLVQEGGDREYEADDQAVAAVSETLEATNGDTMIMHEGASIDDIFA